MAVESGVQREILPAFREVHILHHAGEEPIIGQWRHRRARRCGERWQASAEAQAAQRS
jgi:hypothetical protein